MIITSTIIIIIIIIITIIVIIIIIMIIIVLRGDAAAQYVPDHRRDVILRKIQPVAARTTKKPEANIKIITIPHSLFHCAPLSKS